VRLKSLAGEPFVQFHRKGARTLFDEVVFVCRRAGFSPRIVNEPDFMATVLTLVESGLCRDSVPGNFESVATGDQKADGKNDPPIERSCLTKNSCNTKTAEPTGSGTFLSFAAFL
jgi:hypothetical protein